MGAGGDDHDAGKILTHAAPLAEGFVGRRVGAGGVAVVGEFAEDGVHQRPAGSDDAAVFIGEKGPCPLADGVGRPLRHAGAIEISGRAGGGQIMTGERLLAHAADARRRHEIAQEGRLCHFHGEAAIDHQLLDGIAQRQPATVDKPGAGFRVHRRRLRLDRHPVVQQALAGP